ncbi:MAG TPA: PHP domain-containing protein [Acidimicrobiales bacterium]|nr:PHP domain-containing protein [Acidimicrobiales bacterium]
MIDLHTHSTVSDGSDPPERIAELAAEAGCLAVALTDHDRLDGVERAGARARALGVQFVPGCELSCEVERGTMHVLVYWLAPVPGPLQDELIRLQDARDRRNEHMAQLLQRLGLPVTFDELQAEAGGSGAGRPHVAAILVRKGIVANIQEAFDTWLAKGRPAYVEKERLLAADALRLARASGALPVLAHPLSLQLEPAALDGVVGELADLGLAGLEAIYGRYSPEDRAGLAALAERHGLVVTGGSDHHGTYKPDLQVGVGRGDLDVPDSIMTELAARLPA